MSEELRNSALDIHDLLSTRKCDESEMKEAFTGLSKSVCEEYRRFGSCKYVEMILDGRMNQITVVECSALVDLGNHLLYGRPLTDPFSCRRIPHLNEGSLFWSNEYHWKQGQQDWVVDQAVMQLAGSIDSQAKNSVSYVSRSNGGVQVERGASRITITGPSDGALSNSDGASAERGAESSPAYSEEQMRSMVEDARFQASKILAEANEEAARIRADAQAFRERTEADARAQADALRMKIEAEARGESDRLIKRYLKDYQSGLREQWAREIRSESSEDERFRQIGHEKQELCEVTDALRGDWKQCLDETVERLKAIQNDSSAYLRDWQSSLYVRELVPIAQCYVELYAILNQDALLTRAIMEGFHVGQGSDTSGLRPDTLEALKKLNASLQVYLGKLEKALNRLGLFVRVPQVGDAYDDVAHSPAREVDDPYDMEVARCVMPGVVRAAGDDLANDVDQLIPAVVELRK